MKLSDIPQLNRAHYHITVTLDMFEAVLERYADEGRRNCPFILEPEFQRGHVWTREQQIAFCEFLIRGGESGRTIIFNCRGWMNDFKGPMYLVDGLQRITAIRAMMNDQIPVFGHLYSEYEDHDLISRRTELTFQVGSLKTYAEVLKWYLEMNSGGTPHAQSEIDRVTALWEQERAKL